MTERELRRRLPNASDSFIKANAEDCPSNPASSAEPEPTLRDEPLAAPARKEGNVGRALVRITSYRCRLLDPDNLCPKYFIDGLRYADLIPGDSPAEIILQVSQEKVATRKEECTQIEIEPLDQVGPIEISRDSLIALIWAMVGKSWNRQAFDTFVETMTEDDLRQVMQLGTT